MTAPPGICRLCITTCNDDFKNLYDEYGQANGVYEMTYKYFHPKIVDLDKAKHLTAICLECFRHIRDFHSFQTSIIVAQLKLMEGEKTIYTIAEEIQTPQREICTQTMAIKVETEEFIGLTPDYVVKTEGEEFITLPDTQIENSFPSTKRNNYEIIESLSIGGGVNDTEDEKDNISLPTLEITAAGASSTSTTDDGIPLAKNPPLSENHNSDGVDTQTIVDQKSSDDKPHKKNESLQKLLAKWIPNIKCFKCKKLFPSWVLLKCHFKRWHPDETFYYICCSRKINQVQIKDHLCLHSDYDAFKCTICGKRYTTNHGVAYHYIITHPESLKFPCDKCSKRFESKHALATHQRKMHHQYPPNLQERHSSSSLAKRNTTISMSVQDSTFHRVDEEEIGKDTVSKIDDCEVINYETTVQLSTQNTVFHGKDEESKDNIALPPLEIMDAGTGGSGFSSDDEIPLAQIDERSTSGVVTPTVGDQNQSDAPPQRKYETLEKLLAKWIPQIKCFKCKKSFPSWLLLKSHFKRRHPHEKFHYICCSRKINQVQIKDHLLLHSDCDAFKCTICGQRYTTNHGLTNHYSLRHPECLKVSCAKCSKRFLTNHALSTHRRKMHSFDRQYLQIDHSHQPMNKGSNETTISLSMQDSSFHKVNEEENGKDNLALSKIDICPQPKSESNTETTARLSIPDTEFHDVDEDRIDNIYLPPLDIKDVNTTSAFTSEDEIPLSRVNAKKPNVIGSRSSDSLVTITTDDQQSSFDHLLEKKVTFEYLLAKWIPKIKCYKCSKSFPSWLHLKSHFKHRHPNDKVYYICCSRKFGRHLIYDHLRLHENPDTFKCSICDVRYITNNSLGLHNNEKHPEILKFPCDKCRKRFMSKNELLNHQRLMHKADRQYLLDLQINQSPQPTLKTANETTTSLSGHDPTFHKVDEEQDIKDNISLPPLEIMDVNMGDETVLAQIDDRNPSVSKCRSSGGVVPQTTYDPNSSTDQPGNKRPSLDYLLDKWIPNIKCYKCSKAFPTWPFLKKHFESRHPKEKFYYICCARKLSRHFIKDHLRLHEDPDTFKCILCDKRYTCTSGLGNHYNYKHSENLKFPCNICRKRYISTHALLTHQRMVHSSDRQYLPDLQMHHSPPPASEDNNETTISLSMLEQSFHKADEEEHGKDNMTNSKRDLSPPPRRSEGNNETTVPLSIQDLSSHNANEEENRKYDISLPLLEIMDEDMVNIFSSGEETHLADIVDGNPSDSKSPIPSSDGVVIQATNDQKSTHDQRQKVNETLVDLLAKWIPNIKCFKCSKSFPSWLRVKSHFRHQHPYETFYYKCCSLKFSQREIKDHLSLHDDPDAFKCFICLRRYKTSRILSAHNAETHTESFKFSCDKCGRPFRSKFGLSNHLTKIHHSNRPDHAKIQLMADGRTTYNCQLCGGTKYSKTEFRTHNLKIHGFNTSKFVCKICSKYCISARTFREHMASHERKKIYKCAFCPGTYGTIAAVNIHRIRKHPSKSSQNYYVNIGQITYVEDSESESNESSRSAKSISADLTERDDCNNSPPITVMSTTDLQEMANIKKKDVNRDCDAEIEQQYSISSVSVKNEDCVEKCVPSTSMAAASDRQVKKDKSNNIHTRTRSDILLRPKRCERSRFNNC